MTGAIFYSGKYGSTEQYSKWIGEATGLPVFSIKDARNDPAKYDFLILGSSILYFKLSNRKWVRQNLNKMKGKVKILFSVSGAGPSEKLERWVASSLPKEILSQVQHIALRGKLDHTKVSWWVKLMLYIGSLFNPSKEASNDERYGFDYMDKSTIAPIVHLAKQLRKNKSLSQSE